MARDGSEATNAVVVVERLVPARGSEPKRVDGPQALPAGPVEHVEIAFFHRGNRCSSCATVARLTEATLAGAFADRTARGEIGLTVVDLEAGALIDVARLYGAEGDRVYFGVTKSGRLYTWPVDDVWFYVEEEHRFVTFLTREIDRLFADP